ncbi:MAG: ABC-2 family transporter protein [SAR324 cluster bacterium]|nr:ABC-2 family transporter protein [SAR324 cluster bacterium]
MMTSLPIEFLKWFQTMKVSWSEIMVYRLNFLLMVIGPMLVLFFIKYNVWSSIYQGTPGQEINGYTFAEMISYHLWFMIVSMLSMAYSGEDLAEDIRLGRISSYLIYPFNFWQFNTARFFSIECIQIGIALITLGISFLGFGHILGKLDLPAFCAGFGISILVGFFWFTIQYTTGLLAFWFEETWTFRVLFQIIAHFLSGAIIPLDFYPSWLVDILEYSPFPTLAYIPVKIFLGSYEEPLKAAFILLFWIVVSTCIAAWVWKRGLKLYTAAGM